MITCHREAGQHPTRGGRGMDSAQSHASAAHSTSSRTATGVKIAAFRRSGTLARQESITAILGALLLTQGHQADLLQQGHLAGGPLPACQNLVEVHTAGKGFTGVVPAVPRHAQHAPGHELVIQERSY